MPFPTTLSDSETCVSYPRARRRCRLLLLLSQEKVSDGAVLGKGLGILPGTTSPLLLDP